MSDTTSAVPIRCANSRPGHYYYFKNGESMIYIDGEGPYCSDCAAEISDWKARAALAAEGK
jgi:hypothetical protein